jgi:pimeloyl-ACP methyl ester carboxylesterase
MMRWLKRIGRLLQWILCAIALIAIALGIMLATPVTRPPTVASITSGARAVDQSGMPTLSRFQARDGTWLAYRLYPAANDSDQNIAIVIHGSAGHSTGMNEISKSFAAQNFLVAAPDMRGHGASGTRGDIAYDGQLDNDMSDFVAELRRQHPSSHLSLLGFSAGGGFALRLAAGKLNSDFERVVLLSPYLGYDAPSTRNPDNSTRWANPDLPRFIALIGLRRLGLRCCEGLPVIGFAIPPGVEKFATPEYSFRLISNFGAPRNLSAAFHRLKAQTTIVAGGADELMLSDKYADIVRGITPAIDVKIVPGLSHMDMLHIPAAIETIDAAFAAK